jgi:TRAP-type C4-dicarboxylate transport system substrate-binding protein
VASNFYDQFAALPLPFGFDDYEAKMEALHFDRPERIDNMVEEAAEQEGFRGVLGGGAILGSREPIANNELLTSNDYSGKNIRSPQTKFHESVLGKNGLGANTVQVPPGEIGQALSTGQIDILELPLEFTFAAGYYEQRDYLHNAHHIYNDAVLWMTEELWQDMSDEQRQILRESVEEGSRWQINNLAERESTMVEDIKDAGVTYIEDDAINHEQLAGRVVDSLDSSFPAWMGEIRNEILEGGGPWGV